MNHVNDSILEMSFAFGGFGDFEVGWVLWIVKKVLAKKWVRLNSKVKVLSIVC